MGPNRKGSSSSPTIFKGRAVKVGNTGRSADPKWKDSDYGLDLLLSEWNVWTCQNSYNVVQSFSSRGVRRKWFLDFCFDVVHFNFLQFCSRGSQRQQWCFHTIEKCTELLSILIFVYQHKVFFLMNPCWIHFVAFPPHPGNLTAETWTSPVWKGKSFEPSTSLFGFQPLISGV